MSSTMTTSRALAFTLAGAASCDWRTAERFLQGEIIRGLAAERLRIAAVQLGVVVGSPSPMPLASQPLMLATPGTTFAAK